MVLTALVFLAQPSALAFLMQLVYLVQASLVLLVQLEHLVQLAQASLVLLVQLEHLVQLA